jgi:hypothetical protein
MSAPQHRLVNTYLDILKRSSDMLDLANSGKWEDLVEMQVKTGFMVNPSLLEHVFKNHTHVQSDLPQINNLHDKIVVVWGEIHSKMIARRNELAHLIESAEHQEANGGLGQIIRTNTYSRADLYRNTSK